MAWRRPGDKPLSEPMMVNLVTASLGLNELSLLIASSLSRWLHSNDREMPVKIQWWRHQMETFSALLAFVRGIHRSTVNSQHKGQWRGALMFSLICAWINSWVNNREAGDLRCHYGVIVMLTRWNAPVPLCRIVVRINRNGIACEWRLKKSGIHIG